MAEEHAARSPQGPKQDRNIRIQYIVYSIQEIVYGTKDPINHGFCNPPSLVP